MKKNKLSGLALEFKDKDLFLRALTHRSYLNEHRDKELKSNERMEFLGDAVLELWATEKLFHHFPELTEGILTNVRASLVCAKSLAETAEKIKIGPVLLLSKGEDEGGGRKNPSLLADAFEAVIGALYLDGGWQKVDDFLTENLLKKLVFLGSKGDNKDAKTKLQEKIQAKMRLTPYYKIIREEGPDHAKKFITAVFFDQEKIAAGKGGSKGEAEEAAAKKALTILEKESKIKSKIGTRTVK
ncbi:ribonuclease III [Patescibacteria group bacterium]|nr:ribonuclease III [Patescibacteria group bacterium]